MCLSASSCILSIPASSLQQLSDFTWDTMVLGQEWDICNHKQGSMPDSSSEWLQCYVPMSNLCIHVLVHEVHALLSCLFLALMFGKLSQGLCSTFGAAASPGLFGCGGFSAALSNGMSIGILWPFAFFPFCVNREGGNGFRTQDGLGKGCTDSSRPFLCCSGAAVNSGSHNASSTLWLVSLLQVL